LYKIISSDKKVVSLINLSGLFEQHIIAKGAPRRARHASV